MKTFAQIMLETDASQVQEQQSLAALQNAIGALNGHGRGPAELFVLDDDPNACVYPHIEAGAIDYKAVRDAPNPAGAIAWYEWPTGYESRVEIYRCGAIVLDLNKVPEEERGEEEKHTPLDQRINTYAEFFICTTSRAVIHIGGMSQTRTENLDVPIYGQYAGYNQLARAECGASLWCARFLLATPKAVEIVPHRWDLKLQQSRTKHGKPPLLEFKRVKVLVGEGAMHRRYEGSDEAGGEHGKRLHSVIGHFRELPVSTSVQPRMAWVRPHWRGDAKLGIISKQRDVTYVPDGPGP